MKLNEVTEVGFYTDNLRTKENVFEVITNNDEQWLRDEPEETLLIDTWIYDYTDDDDRKHYKADGSLHSVKYAENIKVYKITDVKYTIPHGNCGAYMYEDKPTYKEKLNIAVKALEKYADKFNWCDCKIKLGIDGFGVKSQEIKALKACYQIQGFSEAEEALAKIKEIK